jgi:hypothetical protein
MNLRCIIILSAVVYISCNDQSQLKITNRNKPTVILQPLQFSDRATLSFLKDSIEKFYPVAIEIVDTKNFLRILITNPVTDTVPIQRSSGSSK